ncbi:MAG: SIMPL domain-containing protein, partial [Rhodobiaceae bacterium]
MLRAAGDGHGMAAQNLDPGRAHGLHQLAAKVAPQIDDKHITASDIQIAPEWEYQPERKLIGHQVSREVTFKVSGVDRYARLADGLAGQGLKEVRPAGSEISNADELAKQALEKAVK